MHQVFDAIPPPLTSKDGVIRVQGTRVSLETIVYAFDRGASPEEIVESYPTLDLAATYAILAYVLQNREEVDRYVERRRAEAEHLRTEIERRFPAEGIRARLTARRAAAEPRSK
jgi:uncharacterized protein (DUF433 family)